MTLEELEQGEEQDESRLLWGTDSNVHEMTNASMLSSSALPPGSLSRYARIPLGGSTKGRPGHASHSPFLRVFLSRTARAVLWASIRNAH